MWDPFESAWQEQYNYVQEYRTIHPDTWPAQKEEYPVDNNLGSWCSEQRKAYTKQELSPDRIQLLEALRLLEEGFMWDSRWNQHGRSSITICKNTGNTYPDRWPAKPKKNILLVITWENGVLTNEPLIRGMNYLMSGYNCLKP